METLIHNISQVLGITILHSLWQGLLIYLLLKIILSCAPSLSSVKKHNISLTAIALLAVWFIVTIVLEVSCIQWMADEAAAITTLPVSNYLSSVSTHTVQPDNSYYYVIKGYLPYITVVYLIGLMLNILRLCFALRNINLVKGSLMPAGQLENIVKKFSLQMNIKKSVLVSYSRLVDVPGVIGFFKPILLLPVAITNNLTSAEVEAILLHELSHIKRNDYLLNLLQQIVSVQLFFNPFAMLINRIINSERENCCDDEVIKTTGQPLIYARALLTLEQSKPNNLQLALAATGKKYHLLNRIERIMTAKKSTVNVRHILAAVLLFAFSLGSIAWLNPEIKNDHIKLTVVNPLLAGYFYNDTVPAVKNKKYTQHTVTQKTVTNGKTSTTITGSDDPELERLSKQVEKEAQFIDKYYSSADYKRLNSEIEKSLDEQTAIYENPRLKELLKKQEIAAAAFEKNFENNAELKKLNAQIELSSKDIEKQYNSPQIKRLEAQLLKSGDRLEKLTSNSPAFNKELEKIRNTSAEIGRLHTLQQANGQEQNMQMLTQKLQGIYQSDAFKKQQAELNAISDSVGKAFSNTMSIKTNELNKKLQALNNSPELLKQQKRLHEANAKLRAYMNSPAYKKRMQQIQREAGVIIPEALEIPEKIEQPEKTEQPEVPEAPKAVDN